MLDTFFAIMEVGPAVRWAVEWAKAKRGSEASVALIGMLFCDVIFCWCAWYFDISTTLEYTRGIENVVASSFATDALVIGPIVLIVATLAPTAIRQTLAGSAAHFKMIAVIFIILNLFDAKTDWPRVRDLFDKPLMWDLFSFAQIGDSTMLQGVLWWVVRGLFLLLATDVFEVVAVASLVATVILLVGSFRKAAPKAATGPTVRLP